jgi:DNA-binding NtrC family response regulator
MMINGPPKTNGKPAILCIDDNVVVRAQLSDVLGYSEYSPVFAANVEDGLRLSNRRDIRLIILDIDLSGENSLALLPYLTHNLPDLPVVLYSGMQHNEREVTSFFEQGASGYVQKCEPMSELLEVIRIALISRVRKPPEEVTIGLGRRVQRLLPQSKPSLER